MTVEQIEALRKGLQESFDLLVSKIGKIQIGKKEQFPYGWRKSAKGRTVWRILEELITQNIEKYHTEFKIDSIIPSDSEVSVFDFECKITGNPTPVYINIKSAVLDGRKNKDDISKGDGLKEFYEKDINKNFFIGTFFIKFNDDMTIEIDHATVFPIAWIPEEFHPLFIDALAFAKSKKEAGNGDIIQEPSGKYLKKVKSRWLEVDEDGNLKD